MRNKKVEKFYDGSDIEWIDKNRLQTVEGMSPDFNCAIHFPSDAIIDSSAYAKDLLKRVIEISDGQAKFLSQTRPLFCFLPRSLRCRVFHSTA